jgi:hypothetical protein
MNHDLLGTYQTPKCKIGQRVLCQARGTVEIIRLSSGRIQWPIAVVPGVGGRSMVLYADLERAVRRETPSAIMHWWGVGSNTVWQWRKALGVKNTPAETARRKKNGKANVKAIRAMHATARDPGRRAKIATARRGKPRSAEVVEGMRKRMLGQKLPKATRAKMSAAQRARGTKPPKAGRPWTAAENELLRALPAADVAKRTGRTLPAIYIQRRRLKMPDGRRKSG